MQDLRNSLYSHLQFMPLRFFTGTRTGEIQSRLSNDVGGVQSVVTDTASSILSNVVTIISTLIAMLILSCSSRVLSLHPAAAVPVAHGQGRARRAGRSPRSTQQTMADMSAITEETLSVSGILLSKSFGRQRHEIGRFHEENERLTGLQIRQTMIGRSFFAVVGIFFSITPALVYLVAGWVTSRTGSPIQRRRPSSAFTTLQSRLFFPIGSMLQVSTEVQSSLALFDRIFEYLDMDHEIEDAPDAVHAAARGRSRGKVRLGHVRFRYDSAATGNGRRQPRAEVTSRWRTRRPASGPSTTSTWTSRPGQLAALVGPSGAGKTTVTYLVPRLYDVQEGSVRIDDIDVRDVTLESLGDMIGVVTQETYLFHTTIRRNLLYGRPDATQEELEAAARAANIHDRIVELPDGYDTVVGERGYKLSGGEKQRLAIARVILKDPRILILDEATSSLDTTSERLVQAALEPLMAGPHHASPSRTVCPRSCGRRHLRDRPGPRRRARHARRAARRQRPVRAAVRAAVQEGPGDLRRRDRPAASA